MMGFFISRVLKELQMKVTKLIMFAAAMMVSLNGFAEGGGDRVFEKMLNANTRAMEKYAVKQGKPVPVVKDYEYGMKLDVVKVVSVVRPVAGCAAVPAAMTYEDSQGQLNTIKYTVAGDCPERGG